MRVSIIIPVIKINDYIRESIPEILKLDHQDLEIIVLPDEDSDEKWPRPHRLNSALAGRPKTKIISTKISNPSIKRNIGVKEATGEIVAFLDDDAYPKKDWLKYALKHFSNNVHDLHTTPVIARTHCSEDAAISNGLLCPTSRRTRNDLLSTVAVGGPAITPQSDSILQKASAAAFESLIGGGGTRNRFLSIGKTKEIDDWPSVNLLVRRDIFLKTGGFDQRYWPGEDTKLCLELLKYGKIIYEPNAVVYHHRRGSLIKHLRQIGNYGLHRGHFAKKFPQTSLRLFYLFPSLFSIYLILGFVLLLLHITCYMLHVYYWFPLYLYFFIMFLDIIIISFRYRNPLVGLATIPYIFLTHFYYGLRFIKGYFSKDISQSTHTKKSQ